MDDEKKTLATSDGGALKEAVQIAENLLERLHDPDKVAEQLMALLNTGKPLNPVVRQELLTKLRAQAESI